MKKALILAACLAACACQPKATAPNSAPSDEQNYHERREQKPQNGGCCETDKAKADKQTVAAPEMKVEKSQ